MKTETLILAAHDDDAAFSASAALGRGVFGVTEHATVFSLSWHLSDESIYASGGRHAALTRGGVSALRREETLRFCRFVGGLRHHELGLTDVPVHPQWIRPGSPYVKEIQDRLARLITRLGCNTIVCPHTYGSNGHTHHTALFLAVGSLIAGRTDLRLILTDDQPYSRTPVDRPLIVRGRVYVPRILKLSRQEWNRKLCAIRIYASQYRDRYFRAVRLPAPGDGHSTPSETLWLPLELATPHSSIDLAKADRLGPQRDDSADAASGLTNRRPRLGQDPRVSSGEWPTQTTVSPDGL